VLRSGHSTVMKIRSIWPRTNVTYTGESKNTNDGVGILKLLHTQRDRSRAVAAPSTRSVREYLERWYFQTLCVVPVFVRSHYMFHVNFQMTSADSAKVAPSYRN